MCCTSRRAALSLASSVGLLTMSQLDAAGRRKDWDKEVVHFRSTCQVRQDPQEGSAIMPHIMHPQLLSIRQSTPSLLRAEAVTALL